MSRNPPKPKEFRPHSPKEKPIPGWVSATASDEEKAEHVAARVERCNQPSDLRSEEVLEGFCWRWVGPFKSGPKPTVNVLTATGLRGWNARRMAWELENGPIPEGFVVGGPKCFRRECVNPQHGQLVTLNRINQTRKIRAYYKDRGL